jgi:phosphate starvation-inducible protein PhoH|tara:strand:- start:1251 stop:2009 length:759 start_codon:yes stop_codon:yes gene_type:complete
MSRQRRISSKDKKLSRREKEGSRMDTKFSMNQIRPLTDTQGEFFDSYNAGYNIAAIGTAGTGKTMCGLYLGLCDILSNDDYHQVIIVRSAVQTREQGFMPGTLQQKEAVYALPYADIVNDLFGRGDAWSILSQKSSVKFMTSSFVRGLTFDNSIIIVDECQSMTYHELDSIITRVGDSSRIIFCGDTAQDDLAGTRHKHDTSGLEDFLKVLSRMTDSFKVVQFGIEDIVRSGLVKEYIIAKETTVLKPRMVA